MELKGAPVSRRCKGDTAFLASLGVIGGLYVLLIVAMVVADTFYTTPGHLLETLRSREIQYSVKLSLFTCSVTTLLSLLVAVPLGYLLSRHEFQGKGLVDTILDIPIVLPPLVVGLSLLILLQVKVGSLSINQWLETKLHLQVTYAIPAVILAQFSVACAFAVRTMKVTFDQITPRTEQVALTLGCSRAQAFWRVTLPEARKGVLTAATLAWARALGEFGPILVFAGATRLKTEVLATSVFLELSIGNLEAAVAVSLLMIAAALGVLLIMRFFGEEKVAQ